MQSYLSNRAVAHLKHSSDLFCLGSRSSLLQSRFQIVSDVEPKKNISATRQCGATLIKGSLIKSLSPSLPPYEMLESNLLGAAGQPHIIGPNFRGRREGKC